MIQVGRVRVPTYRCTWRACERLIEGVEGLHGTLCPYCETGELINVAVVTTRMLARAERADKRDEDLERRFIEATGLRTPTDPRRRREWRDAL